MKYPGKLYWKIFGVFLFIIVTLGGIYIYIASRTVVSYFEETNQHLNASVAEQIAEGVKPLIAGGVNKKTVAGYFRKVMQLNPAAEMYLLDKAGNILAYSAPDSAVKRNSIALAPVEKFIASDGRMFIDGDNPRRSNGKKPFSAARINGTNESDGYIYIILGGDNYESATSEVLKSYKLRITIASVIFTLIAALLIGLVALLFLTRDLNKVIATVKEFQKGNWQKRIRLTSGGDLGVLANTFNNMADTIAANIQDIKSVEESRRELVANVSHDLRTPLAAIQGYAETLLIKKDSLSEKDKEHYTQIVVKSAVRLKTLVDELFELSRLEANVVVPHFEKFSIAELLLDNIVKYRIIAEEKTVDIHPNIPQNMPMVSGDIGLIDRVLQNLIDNALKFTPAGGTIIASLKQVGQEVEVSITDSGTGIPPEKLPYIFDRYAHSDYKGANKGGTGLGLAIVKKILELHNTSIQVESKVVEGTIFSFRLSVG